MPGEMYIEAIERQDVDLTSVTKLLEDALRRLGAFVVFQGETTGPGLPDGSSLLCTDLSEKPDYDGNQVVITSGPYAGQARDIDGATDDGILNPHLPFGGQIDTGTGFAILALRTVPAEVAGVAETLDEVHDKLNILVAYRGEATTDSGNGAALLCSDLSGEPDYDGNQVVLTSGPYAGQARVINGTTTGGIITPDTDFGGAIAAGTRFAVLALKISAAAEPLPPGSGSTAADWNSGTATSGEAGGDVVTVGADGAKYKVHSLIVGISALAGIEVRVKLFTKVNGVEQKVYDQPFDAASDPPGLWIVNGTLGIHDELRVELESNTAGDDGKTVHYDYMLEAM